MQSQMMLDTGLYIEYEFCSFMIYLETECYFKLKKITDNQGVSSAMESLAVTDFDQLS